MTVILQNVLGQQSAYYFPADCRYSENTACGLAVRKLNRETPGARWMILRVEHGCKVIR